MRKLLVLGTRTRWGTVSGIAYMDGEGYYFLLRDCEPTCVSLIPAKLVEECHD